MRIMEKDTVIESVLSEKEQYEKVCKELEDGTHYSPLPICIQMGHNHTISAEGNSSINKK